MAKIERRNGWQIAEEIGDKTPDRTQRLLYRSHWDWDGARDELQYFVIETFGDENGIGIVDETGFLKKGDCSVGVKRQYSGTAGKVENCQIGTFLSYATPSSHVFLDRRLHLPETGLDEYEVRHWHSWHRHITLSAHAWLASIRHKELGEKGIMTQTWQN